MAGKFDSSLQKENAELRKENEGLRETVSKLLAELDRVRQIEPTSADTQTTKELQIVEKQIERYQKMSSERELTLEEIRAVDLLIKNKKLLQAKSDEKDDGKDNVPVASESELLLIAGGKGEQDSKRTKSKTGTKDPVE